MRQQRLEQISNLKKEKKLESTQIKKRLANEISQETEQIKKDKKDHRDATEIEED